MGVLQVFQLPMNWEFQRKRFTGASLLSSRCMTKVGSHNPGFVDLSWTYKIKGFSRMDFNGMTVAGFKTILPWSNMFMRTATRTHQGSMETHKLAFIHIAALRLSSWALHVIALVIEGFTAFGCMFYLAKVRCSIFATIGNIVFSYGLTTEKIYPGNGLNDVYASQSAAWQSAAVETFDTSIIFTWLSICLAFTASWLWLSAAYVQTPAHVSFNPTVTISQTPLFSTTKSLTRT
ncbi:unnamed protein product [Schistocephalus solidus]|uniref:Ammonium_transp domain-containing protein n=1 Tax=Schistocephalus solidus TaxID=70667 RepID=A0A183SIV3_SCHSO|nr:unnamed protein product [Schistocephalus solidus]